MSPVLPLKCALALEFTGRFKGIPTTFQMELRSRYGRLLMSRYVVHLTFNIPPLTDYTTLPNTLTPQDLPGQNYSDSAAMVVGRKFHLSSIYPGIDFVDKIVGQGTPKPRTGQSVPPSSSATTTLRFRTVLLVS